MIAENTRQLLAPVNQWLPIVWKFLAVILLAYIIYSITAVILRFLARKIKRQVNNVCSFKWIDYEEVKNVAGKYKNDQQKKGNLYHAGTRINHK